jgi:hypothetical protein
VNTITKRFIIERGDIYLIELTTADSSKGVKRPVLVIQNDIGNLYCNSVLEINKVEVKFLRNLITLDICYHIWDYSGISFKNIWKVHSNHMQSRES